MNEARAKAEVADFWSCVWRGMRERCPCCGQGRLLRAYLKPVEACAVCGEAFGHIEAHDAPAWLTIIIVGHILAPILLIFVPGTRWPEWVSMTVWPLLGAVLMAVILPRAKGVFIALIWRMQGAPQREIA